MSVAPKPQSKRQQIIADMGLEQYALELDMNGYTVVPPSVTGLTPEKTDKLCDLLLKKSEELVGCRFTIEDGPESELDFGDYAGSLARQSGAKPGQFQLMPLCTFDRAFSNLANEHSISTVIRARSYIRRELEMPSPRPSSAKEVERLAARSTA